MKTAHEIYSSSDPHLITAYYDALETLGLQGNFAKKLLSAQRTQARYQKAAANPPPDGDYLRYVRNRNEYAIADLVKFCLAHRHELPIRLRDFKYGVRVTIRSFAALRFRAQGAPGKWTGDEANLVPICEFCDALMREYAESMLHFEHGIAGSSGR